MNKKLLILFLFFPVVYFSCKTPPVELDEPLQETAEIPEIEPEYRWGVYISQFQETNLPQGRATLVPLAKAPFQIVFPVHDYMPEERMWYAVKILATDNALQEERFRTGVSLDEFPGLAPGTGMSTGDGPYESITVREDAHHYIVFDPADPVYQRARLLDTDGEMKLVSWDIESVTYKGRVYSIRNIPTPGFTIIIVNDMNLNGVVDGGEWYKAELRFTE